MARYIDADELKLDIDLSQGASVLDMALSVIRAVRDAPTADVVPKSEVETLRHDIEMIIDEGEYWEGKYLVAKQEVAREIFAEIRERMIPIFGCPGEYMVSEADINEIRDKYTVKDCRTCTHLVSCEPNPHGICDEYEEKKQ